MSWSEGLYLRSFLRVVDRLTDSRDVRIPAKRDQNHPDGARGDILTWCDWSARLVSWVRYIPIGISHVVEHSFWYKRPYVRIHISSLVIFICHKPKVKDYLYKFKSHSMLYIVIMLYETSRQQLKVQKGDFALRNYEMKW